jgi:hypothetical protein
MAKVKMAKGRSKKLEIQLRQNNMNVWQQYKLNRAVMIKLDEIGLPGLWIKAIPNSAFESATINSVDKNPNDEEKGNEYFKLWVIDWNLPDNNDPPGILPIPSKSDAYLGIVPLEVTIFVAKKINEVDQERLAIPLANVNPSSPPSAATAPAQSG